MHAVTLGPPWGTWSPCPSPRLLRPCIWIKIANYYETQQHGSKAQSIDKNIANYTVLLICCDMSIISSIMILRTCGKQEWGGVSLGNKLFLFLFKKQHTQSHFFSGHQAGASCKTLIRIWQPASDFKVRSIRAYTNRSNTWFRLQTKHSLNHHILMIIHIYSKYFAP
jgi:hypothetical protein